jgi:hypothetical protein
MPIYKSRHNYTKVYRPDRTQYSVGQGSRLEVALASAISSYIAEFGVLPPVEETVIECVGSTNWWTVQYFNIYTPRE